MPDMDPDDRRAEALAARLKAACRGETPRVIFTELVCTLGKLIGQYPLHSRAALVADTEAALQRYVAEIPPLPTDPYPGADHAA